MQIAEKLCWNEIKMMDSEKLPTYPSPKPSLCPKWEVSVNVSLGEGWWAVSHKPKLIQNGDTYATSLEK